MRGNATLPKSCNLLFQVADGYVQWSVFPGSAGDCPMKLRFYKKLN